MLEELQKIFARVNNVQDEKAKKGIVNRYFRKAITNYDREYASYDYLRECIENQGEFYINSNGKNYIIREENDKYVVYREEN